MNILVTGGTGVVGESVVRTLHRRGHAVRVLSRHAAQAEPTWPVGVEAWTGDVSDEKSIRGAGRDCDAVVHIAGIVAEAPPARTFQSVNIDGTRYVVLEAERAGVRRLVYVSSLGVDRGQSAYHKSKCVAEDVVETFSREWVVVRPGAVYGPGDEHISVLLQMVRSLPVIPTIGGGDQRFQPIWHEDLAEVLALCVERGDVCGRVLEVAGPELTSQNDLTARLRAITERLAVQAPLPEVVASWGIRALDAIGIDAPISEAQVSMLAEENFIRAGAANALTDVFGLRPTLLDEGLRRLAGEQPDQYLSAGVGPLTRKRYWIDLSTGRRDPDELFAYLRRHLPELMPPALHMKLDAAEGARIDEGSTLTLDLPLRGQVQVHAVEVEDRRMTLLTVAGHPLVGAVRLLVKPMLAGEGTRFEIEVYDRAATMVDRVLLRVAGDWLQRAVWVGLAERVLQACGSAPAEVQSTEETLDDRQLQIVDSWARALSAQSSRNSTSSGRD